MGDEWNEKDFSRRAYDMQSEDFEDARIEVIVRVNGRQFMQVQMREPGMIALVSRPDDEGIQLEMIEPRAGLFTDIRLPSGAMSPGVTKWQQLALFGEKEEG